MSIRTMDNDRLFFSHGFLAEFIGEYKRHPCLWDAKSKDYINNQERHAAWTELLVFCEQKLGNVDLEWLKRKVHSMKGSFNKERKKMKDARRAGFIGEWQPKLWYYEHLLFTKSHEQPGDWMIKKEYDDESDLEGKLMLTGDPYAGIERVNGWTEHQPNEETNSTVDTEPEAASNSEPRATDRLLRKRRASQSSFQFTEKRNSPLEHVEVELGKPECDDVYESIGKVVASKLRALGNTDYTQFIRVDRLINEAIYRGFQKQLTPDCEIAVERPQISNHPTISIRSNPVSPPATSYCPQQTYNIYLPQNPPLSPLPIPPSKTTTTTTSTTSNSSICLPKPPHPPSSSGTPTDQDSKVDIFHNS